MDPIPTNELRVVRQPCEAISGSAEFIADYQARLPIIAVQRKWLVADGESYEGIPKDASHINIRGTQGSGDAFKDFVFAVHHHPLWQPTREEWRDLPEA